MSFGIIACPISERFVPLLTKKKKKKKEKKKKKAYQIFFYNDLFPGTIFFSCP